MDEKTATELSSTPFGLGKTFTEIEHCVTMPPADEAAIRQIAGDHAADILTLSSPRPLAEISDDDILVVLRGINFNDGAQSEDMVSVRIWLNKTHIIASENLPVRSVDTAEKALPTLSTTPEVMARICEEIFNGIEKHIADLDGLVDEAEDAALADPNKKRRLEIMEFRRSVIALRRYLLPQRETMMTLSRGKSSLLDDTMRQVLTDQYYRAARICDYLDALRERLSLIQEEITAILSDRLNENMYILAMISLVFLPLGFLTGLFGINVGGMPGLENASAFWLVVLGCVAVAMLIFLAMKIKKWL